MKRQSCAFLPRWRADGRVEELEQHLVGDGVGAKAPQRPHRVDRLEQTRVAVCRHERLPARILLATLLWAPAVPFPSRRPPWIRERAPPPTGISPSTRPSTVSTPDADLVFLFASYHHAERYPEIVSAIHERLSPRILARLLGAGRDHHRPRNRGSAPASPCSPLSLPEADLTLKRISAGRTRRRDAPRRSPPPARGRERLGPPLRPLHHRHRGACRRPRRDLSRNRPSWAAWPPPSPAGRSAYLFEGANLAPGGALLLAVGGAWTVLPVVSQGAEPIGESWTVTEAERNIVVAIGGRPALDVLMETLRDLEPGGPGTAPDGTSSAASPWTSTRDELGRGDFLIRNLLGVDRERGAVAINDNVRVGQTLQFQLRDAEAATDELNALLDQARDAMAGEAAGGLLCACNGRGQGMFGAARPRRRSRRRPPRRRCPSRASSATARLVPWAARLSCTASLPASPSSCP